MGLAWDRYNFNVVQHFEGGHVAYSQPPAIRNGILSMSGQTGNGAEARDGEDIRRPASYYDPPPHPLTRGQLSRTYCYGPGTSGCVAEDAPHGRVALQRGPVQHDTHALSGPLRGQPRRARAQLARRGARVLAERVRRQPVAGEKDRHGPVDHRLGVDRQRGPVLRDRRPERSPEEARKRRIHRHAVGPDGQREDGGLTILDIPRGNPAQRVPGRPMSGQKQGSAPKRYMRWRSSTRNGGTRESRR